MGAAGCGLLAVKFIPRQPLWVRKSPKKINNRYTVGKAANYDGKKFVAMPKGNILAECEHPYRTLDR